MSNLKKRLLEAYKILYKNNPKEYQGACKMSMKLNLSEEEHGYNYYGVHNLLLELKRDGFLEQKKYSGFRLFTGERGSGFRWFRRR